MKKLITLSIFLLYITLTHAQTALENSWITNGRVNHIVTGDGKVLLMGDFDWFGPAYYGGTIAFNTSLVEDENYPKIEEEVLTAISDDAGGWYAGIQDRSGTYESKIIHIHADKTIDELPVALGGSTWVGALAKSGNILYFAGYFQSVNGTTRNSAAAINLTDNTLTSWNPNVDVNGSVNVLTVSGSTVYAGGSFSNIGGQPRTYVAALDATTGLATSWNVTITGNSLAEVNTILVNAGVVYIGGYFDNVNAAAPSRRHFAAINAVTGTLEPFNPRPDGRVRTLLLDGPMLYMAGGFDQVFGIDRFRVARIELATSTLMPFELIFISNSHSNYFGFDRVNAIGIDGGNLFIGGTFRLVNGEQQPHLAKVDKVSGVLEPSDKKIDGEVNTLLINGGNIFVGGYITGHLGTSVHGIAILDEATGTGLTEWANHLPAPPEDEYYEDFDFHYQDGRMYYFLNISDGTTHLGALDASDGSVINTWSVTINHHIGDWAFSDDVLYLADEGITAMTINGQTRNRFAAVNLETGALLPFTINFPLALDEQTITSMAMQNNVLYVAGEFSFSENSNMYDSFTAFDATTGTLLPWNPLIDEFSDSYEPEIAAVTNSQIYLLGNGIIRRVHPETGVADSWDTGETDILSLAVHNNSTFVGGWFSPGLVHLDVATGQPVAWQPDLEDVQDGEGSIRAIAVAGGKLLVGGNFYYNINGIQRYYYAEYLLPTNSTNSAPEIQAFVQSVPIQGKISILLTDIIIDADDNLDLSTATITVAPASEALAYIENEHLIIDYGQTPFSGNETLTLRVCDTEGACTEQEITIEIRGDVTVYNGISPNGDGKNDILFIQYIDVIPDAMLNHVSIYNRWGDLVWEAYNYNNDVNFFSGVNKNGNEVSSGIYFYKIQFNSNRKEMTGYITLNR